MIIDHSLRLVFQHVPKCAGTALRTAWQEAAEGRDLVSLFDFGFDPVLQRQVDLAHQPLMDLRHRREWRFVRNYHVVACIRHPYQRLASACREYYRQYSRETELEMRRQPPSRNQLLHYLRHLPRAMDAHDLRYVHGFPITWFSHYGTRPMVDTLLRCGQLANDLEKLCTQLELPQALRNQLERVGAGERRRNSAALDQVEQDPDLRALAHVLHREDFRCFGFERTTTCFQDPELKELIEQSQAVGPSHCLPLTNLTPQMRWYYGRSSERPEPVLRATRAPRSRQ